MSLRLETLGALVEDGDGWALFGRTLLVRVGWVGGLPVELGSQHSAWVGARGALSGSRWHTELS